MAASNYISPAQFKSAPKAAKTPPVTPPTSAPTSSGAGPSAASMWSFTAASKTAANQSGS